MIPWNQWLFCIVDGLHLLSDFAIECFRLSLYLRATLCTTLSMVVDACAIAYVLLLMFAPVASIGWVPLTPWAMGQGPATGPWSMDHGPCFIVHGPWTTAIDHEASGPRACSLGALGSGPWIMDLGHHGHHGHHGPWTRHGPWSMDHGPCFIVYGPWTTDMGHKASGLRARSLGPGASMRWTMEHGHHGHHAPWTPWAMGQGP